MQASQSIALKQFYIRSNFYFSYSKLTDSRLGPKKQDLLPKIKTSQREPQYYTIVNSIIDSVKKCHY